MLSDQPDAVAIGSVVMRRAMALVSKAWHEQRRTCRPLGPEDIAQMQALIAQDAQQEDPALPADCRIVLAESQAAGTSDGQSVPGVVLDLWHGDQVAGRGDLKMTPVSRGHQRRGT